MRAFASFLVMLAIVGALGYYGLTYVRDNAEKFKEGSLPARVGKDLRPTDPEKLPRALPDAPRDYHLLEGLGGIPRATVEQMGLSTAKWAFLRALTPIQRSEGVEDFDRVSLRGKQYELGMRFTPTEAQNQYLEYSLGGKWDELHFGFGFADDEPSAPDSSNAIELQVLVDGRIAFGPQRLTPTDKPVFNRVRLTGANRVLVMSRRIGFGNNFSPVLLDPCLRLSTDAPTETTTAADSSSK